MEINLKTLQSNADWLRLFAELGKEAQHLLNCGESLSKDITWNDLGVRFFNNAYPPVSSASYPDHERWLRFLKSWAIEHQIPAPTEFTRIHASLLAQLLHTDGIAPRRRFRFYKRVWRTLELDGSVWDVREALTGSSKEYYRRLTTREVRKLVECARRHEDDLADMILIGYWTGLRLSDVAELERSEIQLRQHALIIVPNKVRTRKPQALHIPLVGDALEVVRTRAHEDRYLFPEKSRVRISRRLKKIFVMAKIKKIGNGRASFHSLRATFISLMDEAGIQPYITDAITGHSSGNMHARYTQPALPVLRRAIVKAIPRIGSDTVSDALIPRRDKVNLAERGQTVCWKRKAKKEGTKKWRNS